MCTVQDDAAIDALKPSRPVDICQTRLERLWVRPDGETRSISWALTVLKGEDGDTVHVVATGMDVTERRKMEQTVLEVSAREQRRI